MRDCGSLGRAGTGRAHDATQAPIITPATSIRWVHIYRTVRTGRLRLSECDSTEQSDGCVYRDYEDEYLLSPGPGIKAAGNGLRDRPDPPVRGQVFEQHGLPVGVGQRDAPVGVLVHRARHVLRSPL